MEESFRKFSAAGYAAVSMQQIADAAQVNKATLYHHFRDKEALFYEVMRLRFGQSQENLARAVAAGTTIEERLVRFGEYLFGPERTDITHLFTDFNRHVDAGRQAQFWETFARPWSYLEGPLAEAMASGEIRQGDPVLVAQVCFSAFAGQIQMARFDDAVPSPDAAVAREIAGMLLDGLRAR